MDRNWSPETLTSFFQVLIAEPSRWLNNNYHFNHIAFSICMWSDHCLKYENNVGEGWMEIWVYKIVYLTYVGLTYILLLKFWFKNNALMLVYYLHQNWTVHGLYWGSYKIHRPGVLDESIKELLSWVARGLISIRISHAYRLPEVRNSYSFLTSYQSYKLWLLSFQYSVWSNIMIWMMVWRHTL